MVQQKSGVQIGKVGGLRMRLTEKEQEICNEYSNPEGERLVKCSECPLNLHRIDPWKFGSLECYATVDGRKAKGIKRYK